MTATDDYTGLLAAVCANPDDDAPRLILADWFEENGQPERGEFIRVQCELARIPEPIGFRGTYKIRGLPKTKWDERAEYYDRLAHRAGELLAAHGNEWAMAELVRPCGFAIYKDVSGNLSALHKASGQNGQQAIRSWHWSRGMIDSIEADSETVLGRECERCRGEGRAQERFGPDYEMATCAQCHGTGRICGCAAAIGRTTVREVRLTDKRPFVSVHGGWRWMRGTDVTQIHIPAPIYDLLELATDKQSADSEAAAVTALARAMAVYCRQQAGAG